MARRENLNLYVSCLVKNNSALAQSLSVGALSLDEVIVYQFLLAISVTFMTKIGGFLEKPSGKLNTSQHKLIKKFKYKMKSSD